MGKNLERDLEWKLFLKIRWKLDKMGIRLSGKDFLRHFLKRWADRREQLHTCVSVLSMCSCVPECKAVRRCPLRCPCSVRWPCSRVSRWTVREGWSWRCSAGTPSSPGSNCHAHRWWSGAPSELVCQGLRNMAKAQKIKTLKTSDIAARWDY